MKITLPEIGEIHSQGLCLAHDGEGIAIEMGAISIQPSENMDELAQAISALPELLQSLESAVKLLLHTYPNALDPENPDPQISFMLESLRKAGATIED